MGSFNVLSQYFGEIVVEGGFDTCTAFGAVYGGGTALPPTQPPIIEMIRFNHGMKLFPGKKRAQSRKPRSFIL
jgi:hypothetical protein